MTWLGRYLESIHPPFPLPPVVQGILAQEPTSARNWSDRLRQGLDTCLRDMEPPSPARCSDIAGALDAQRRKCMRGERDKPSAGSMARFVAGATVDGELIREALIWQPWAPWGWFAAAILTEEAGRPHDATILLIMADAACERLAREWPHLLDHGVFCTRDFSPLVLGELVRLVRILHEQWLRRGRPERAAPLVRDIQWLVDERLPAAIRRQQDVTGAPFDDGQEEFASAGMANVSMGGSFPDIPRLQASAFRFGPRRSVGRRPEKPD